MPEPYVSLALLGQACLKVDADDGRQVSVAFTRPDSMLGEPIARPSFDPSPVKMFHPSGDEIAYSNAHDDTRVALLYALADLLGYAVTKH